MAEVLKHHQVIGDVVKDLSFVPSVILHAEYGPKIVNIKNTPAELLMSETQLAPVVKARLPEGTKYVLVMTDPDAPSRQNPVKGEWCHWIVSGISKDNADLGKGHSHGTHTNRDQSLQTGRVHCFSTCLQ
eukprot:GHVS01075048.1.p2 GENE.GHVS01075048.1~~GHVS01075048.1.p2  ORF type:complete len:130 (+),score=8.23 GHVS01075048.1:619-1008(+)